MEFTLKVRRALALGLKASVSDFLLVGYFHPLSEMITNKELGWRKLFLILTGRIYAFSLSFFDKPLPHLKLLSPVLIINPTSCHTQQEAECVFTLKGVKKPSLTPSFNE